jgi:hypothetical protein
LFSPSLFYHHTGYERKQQMGLTYGEVNGR